MDYVSFSCGKFEAKTLISILAAQFDIDNSISAGISSSILHPTSAPVNIPNSPLTNSLGKLRNLRNPQTKIHEFLSNLPGLLHSTKPVNIPSNNFSPSSHPNLFMQGENFMPMSGSAGSAPKINNNSFSHSDGLFMQHSSHLVSSLNEGLGSISPDLRWHGKLMEIMNRILNIFYDFRMNFEARISEMNQLNSDQQMMNNSNNTSNNLFDSHLQKYPISPMMNSSYNAREDSMRGNFELWKMEMDRKVRKCQRIYNGYLINFHFLRSQYLKSNVMKH